MSVTTLQRNYDNKPKRVAKRRPNKPMMERRRRARINNSMEQLKDLLVEGKVTNKSKLDKADVLELSVRHLRSLHWIAESADENELDKFRNGFDRCYQEALRYLDESSSTNKSTEHLSSLASHLRRISDEISLLCRMNLVTSDSTMTSVIKNEKFDFKNNQKTTGSDALNDQSEELRETRRLVWRPW